MLFERVVVDVVLLLPPAVSPIAKMTSFMFLPTMDVEFIIAIETLSTKATFRVPLESALIDSSRVVVAELFMFSQLGYCEQLMLVGKDLLVPGTQVAHSLVMSTFDMTVEIRPAVACNIAATVRTIVP